MATSPTVLRWYIALELGRLRKDAGWTLKQSAERLGCSLSHISHLESGRSLPPRAELEVLLDFYGVGERIPPFVDLLTACRRGKDWWLPFAGTVPPWFDLYLGLETAASQIESYDAQVVPGLFQTPRYMEAVIRAVEADLAEDEIGRRINLRLARQEVLTRTSEPPPTVWSVLDESVLHGSAGDPAIMSEQLRYLLKLASRPNITILVLPLAARPHAGLDGTFSILSFPDLAGAPAVGYADGRIRGSYYEDPTEVLRYRNTLTRLHDLACHPEESQAMIRRRLEELP
ncbi:MAG TPA: helix-turn-helix transcriptional regulator [Pseudonocardia sp.]|uniref:helix-turn-helix domain-containing protein n=1 Tax=Pseudonocardia sp. TaxID=60912 RepID=UPI002F3FC86B